MGVAYGIKTFEVDKDTESRIQIDNRYYIDMEALVIAESMVGNDPERYCEYDIECMGVANEKR